MSEPKRYHIDTFDKLCNVANKDNIERLAIDLAQWIIYYAEVIEQVREKHPEETKGKTNSQIAEGTFIWVDDGKNDLLETIIENATTGEITNVKYNNLNSEQKDEQNVATDDDKQKKSL